MLLVLLAPASSVIVVEAPAFAVPRRSAAASKSRTAFEISVTASVANAAALTASAAKVLAAIVAADMAATDTLGVIDCALRSTGRLPEANSASKIACSTTQHQTATGNAPVTCTSIRIGPFVLVSVASNTA